MEEQLEKRIQAMLLHFKTQCWKELPKTKYNFLMHTIDTEANTTQKIWQISKSDTIVYSSGSAKKFQLFDYKNGQKILYNASIQLDYTR